MTERTAKLVFWVGTLASAVLFLALTWDTHGQFDALTHADKLSEQVVEGKRVFEKRNCNDCHTILGFGGYYAPGGWRPPSGRPPCSGASGVLPRMRSAAFSAIIITGA